MLILALCAVPSPAPLGAQRAPRRVIMMLRNAPPSDSAAAVAVLRAALERDSTVIVVDPPSAQDLRTGRYRGAQYVLDVVYRKDRGGERLEMFVADIATGEIVRRDTLRYEGNERTLRVPSVPIPIRPPHGPLPLTHTPVVGSGRGAVTSFREAPQHNARRQVAPGVVT